MNYADKVKYFYEKIVSGNSLDEIDSFIHTDCKLRMNGKWQDVGNIKEQFEITNNLFPDLSLEVIRQFVDGDTVVTDYIAEASYTKQEVMKLDALKGKKFRYTGIYINKLKDGKIIEHTGEIGRPFMVETVGE